MEIDAKPISSPCMSCSQWPCAFWFTAHGWLCGVTGLLPAPSCPHWVETPFLLLKQFLLIHRLSDWPAFYNTVNQLHFNFKKKKQKSLFRHCLLSCTPRPGRFVLKNFFWIIWLYWILHCCVQAFSSCGEWRLLSSRVVTASPCGGFSCCGAWAPGCAGSVVTAPGPQSTGSVVGPGRSRSVVCGILLAQGWNPCSLH